MHMVYENIKNENVYILLDDHVFNSTNEQDGQRMCLYCPSDNPSKTYVRSYSEFHEKFSEIQLGE